MDIAELGLRVDSLETQVASDRLARFSKEASKAETATEKMERQIQKLLKEAAKLAAAFAGFDAARRFIMGALDAARLYGKAIAEVGTLLADVSGLKAQSTALRELAKRYGTEGVAQVKAYYEAVSAGAKAGAEALNLVAVANRAAIGSVAETATVVDILTTATNAYAASNLTAGDAADTLFIGVAAGKTTFTELANSMGRLIPTATAANLSFDSMVAAVAALTLQGQDTRLAVTGMSAAIASIITPTSQAADMARELGLEFNLAALESKGFQGFLQDVVAKSKGSKEALAILFGSMEASRAVFSLAGEGGKAFTEILKQMENRAGATDAAFNKMSKTADFQMKRLGSVISDAMITAGDAMLQFVGPAVAFLADNFEELISIGGTLAMVIGTVLVARAGAALLTWLATSAAAWYANTLQVIAYQAALARMAGLTATAAAAQTALGTALAFMGGPLGLAIIAVGALSLALYNSVAARAASLAKETEGITSLHEYTESLRQAREERELLNRAEQAGVSTQEQSAIEDRTKATKELVEVERRLAEVKVLNMASQGAYTQSLTQLTDRQIVLNGIINKADTEFFELGLELGKSEDGMNKFIASMGPLKDLSGGLVDGVKSLVNLFRGVSVESQAAAAATGVTTTVNAEYVKSLQETTLALTMQHLEMTKGKQAALEWEAMQKTGAKNVNELSASVRAQIKDIVRLDAAVKAGTAGKKDEGAAAKALNKQLDNEVELRHELMVAQEAAVVDAAAIVKKVKEETEATLLTKEALRRLNAERALEAEIKKAGAALSAKRIKEMRAEMDASLDTLDAAELAKKSAEDLEQILARSADTEFSKLVSEINLVEQALREATDPAVVARLQKAMGSLKHEMVVGMVGSAQQVLGSMQSMAKEGSKSYKAMEIASSALNVALAISAILTQGKGDPWTAPARMAAMAALVSSIIGLSMSVGGGSAGGGSSGAEARQDQLGTGTVLGDAEAQSESIVNALEITADATTELVALNRGMLNALHAMQAGISGAAAGIARLEFGQVSLAEGAGMNSLLNPFGASTIGGSIISSIFGGEQDLIDQGIRLQGGSFGSVSQNPNASSYQTIETDGGWFGGDDINDELAALSDTAVTQIRLILQSIGDAVREGARALGLNMDEVNAAIEAFRIEEIRISTMDLTGDEAQQQLEAAFSAIFDNLAGDIVPFIAQFQRVGEGLGETLIRVATGVQVTQEALLRLGFSLEETGPEAFAQISESLIDLAGGIEEFINSMSTFVDKFAPEAYKFELLQSDITRALEQVGLTVPLTREAMWELMQTLDATTESGREQIAALLRLAGVSDAYYSQLERIADNAVELIDTTTDLATLLLGVDTAMSEVNESARDWAGEMAALVEKNDALIARAIALGATEEELARIRAFAQHRVDDLTAAEQEYAAALEEVAAAQRLAATSLDRFLSELERGSWGEPIQSLIDLDNQYRDHIATIQQLARESGRGEASQAELVMATRWYQRQLAKLAAQIMESAIGLLGQLGYTGYTETDTVGTELGGIDQVESAVEDRYARELQLLQQLDEFVRSLNLSAVSPLTPTERLGEAEAEYQRLLALAQAGDLEALAELQGAAQAYLEEAHGFFGGVGLYPEIFNGVRDALAGLVDAGPQSQPLGPTTPVIGGPVLVNPGDGFTSINERERALLTQQLVDHLAALSIALNTPILQLMEEMNIPLAQLAADLGANLENLTGASVEVIAQLAYDLGLPLGELVQALGLELPALAVGIRELAEEMGLNLTNLTTETAFGLAELAGRLNTDLVTLTESLGISLGALTDANSPIFLALQQTIDTLSPEIRAQLSPLLGAITTATTEADANEAIAAAELAINGMPIGIRDALAPYFAGVFPAGALVDLDYLGAIDLGVFNLSAIAGRSEGLLYQILQNIQEQNRSLELPTYAQGTAFVPSTGPAMLHAGEMVIPRDIANRLSSGSLWLGSNDGDEEAQPSDSPSYAELLTEVRAMRAESAAKLDAIANNTGVVAKDVSTPKPHQRGKMQ